MLHCTTRVVDWTRSLLRRHRPSLYSARRKNRLSPWGGRGGPARGVAEDVVYVAAEYPADGGGAFHECHAAGLLPEKAAKMERRVDRGVQPDTTEHAGGEPGAPRSRRSRHRRD